MNSLWWIEVTEKPRNNLEGIATDGSTNVKNTKDNLVAKYCKINVSVFLTSAMSRDESPHLAAITR